MIKDARQEAVSFALAELAAECIKPEINVGAEINELELELVPMVGLYRGEWAENECERLFIAASLA